MIATQSVEIEVPSETSELVERPPAPKTNCFLRLANKNDDWYWAQPTWKRILMHCAGFWQVVLWLFAILCFIRKQWLQGVVNCLFALGQAAFEQWATENRAAIEAKCGGTRDPVHDHSVSLPGGKFTLLMLAESLCVIAVAIFWPWFVPSEQSR